MKTTFPLLLLLISCLSLAPGQDDKAEGWTDGATGT